MNWLDIVILVSIACIALIALRLGGVHVGATGVGILAGIALASRLHERVSPLFSRFMDSENGAEIAAFIAIFIAMVIVSLLLGSIVQALSRRVALGWIDRVTGLALGVVVSLAIGSAVLSAIQSYPILGLDDTISASFLGAFLADNFDVVLRGLAFIPDDLGI